MFGQRRSVWFIGGVACLYLPADNVLTPAQQPMIWILLNQHMSSGRLQSSDSDSALGLAQCFRAAGYGLPSARRLPRLARVISVT